MDNDAISELVAGWSGAVRNLLPDAAWGVLFGALTTLVATLISNRHARHQLQEQLSHSAEQTERARLMQLRRDVYLPAAEAITGMFEVIPRLANLETDEATIDVSHFSGSIAKLQMIAGNDVVRSVSTLSTEIGATILGLLNKRLPLRLLRGDINIANTWYEKYSQERTEYLELMKQFNLAGQTDQDQWNRIKRGYDFADEQAEKHREQRDALLARQLRAHQSYVKECFSEFQRVYALSVPALIAVRRELGMPDTDSTALSEALEHQNRRMGEELERLVSSTSALADLIESDSGTGTETK